MVYSPLDFIYLTKVQTIYLYIKAYMLHDVYVSFVIMNTVIGNGLTIF